ETQKMFEDCWSLTLVNIKQFDMSKVTNATKMFNGCSSLRYIIHEGDWSGLSGLSSSYDIFADCTSLKGEKGPGYNYEHINQSWARPDGGEGDEGYFSKSVPELYAVLSDEGKTLTIRYDTKKEENDGLTLGSESIDGQKVTKVVFDASVADARPTSTKDWFSEFEALEEIENLYYLNTEAVTDMSYMFYDCSSLKTLDLGNFKTRNVKNMYGMFAYCTSLTNVPLYNFDTRNVEDMSYMFYECKSLTTLDLYHFNTGKVKIMQAMFARCSSRTSLGLNKFDTRNVEGMSGMFQECPSLVGLDLSSFDMSNVENVAFMFYGCSSLAYIVHSGDWSKKYFKSWCSTQVFTNCFELHGDNGTTYDEDFTGISLARPDGGKLSPGYFSTSVPECYAVPSNANKTLTLYYDGKLEERGGISFWMDETYRENVTKIVLDTSMVYYRPGDLSLWFSGFQVLKEIEHLDYLNTSQTVQMVSMFEGCAALESFDLSRFDTRNVNGMSGMFKDCKSIKELHLASFDTEHANSYSNMFQGCTSLEVVDIRPFCKNEGAYFNEMFADCPALKTIYWYADWTDVEDYYATDMFKGCTALTGDHETAYDEGHVDNSWARLDEGEGKSGYFSLFDGQEPYTMYDETEKTLTYYNDNLRFKREGILDDCFERKHFEEYQEIVTKVVFTPEFVTVTPTSTNLWFFYCLKLETIEGLEYFNTEKVTDMYGMFANCTSLTSLDLSSFNTANVTDMFSMFYDCKKLTSLDLSSFNTANVTDMSYMFASCSALTSLDLSSFNTEKVKDKSCMFENCSALKTILCIEDWSTMIELEYDSYMFEGCVNLTGGKGTPFYDTKVDKTYARPDGGPESETPGYFTVPTYTVTFLDKDGNPIGEPQTVDYGQAAVAPTAPEEKGYEFTGWDKAFDNVTEDLTVQALYEAIVLYTLTVIVEPAEGGTFTVTGLDENQQGAFFAEFVITATPNEGYELVGWKDGDMMLDSKELTINRVLYGDMTITILFKKKTGTGVDEIVNRQSSNRTYLLDGVLYIERDGKTYDVTGRVISRN
ncbi:MAG: BspA family leucine-rich repeat surface protein, partial [Paludibacteraceae bacterium]|nr:BspA family leucine-rich repeat surface protein [Paludibacteraceae bacterium]